MYRCLNKSVYSVHQYSIVPLRLEDRYDIMKWRNEQMYHLRQNKPLTSEEQDRYFYDVVNKLFDQKQPPQILFSFLQNDICVGYGGLVHINWVDKNAEISFLISTELEKENFCQFWKIYLSLIEAVAFDELFLHKIYTYAYDLRPLLYNALEESGFFKDAVLNEHVHFNGKYINVVMHAKLNSKNNLRIATIDDIDTTFKWANYRMVRRFSINTNSISWKEHKGWFEKKINNPACRYYIFSVNGVPAGSIRFDIDPHNNAQISYLIDPQYHGKKLGVVLLKTGIDHLIIDCPNVKAVCGYVMKENIASIKTFEKLFFDNVNSDNSLLKFTKKITNENC